MSMFSRQSYFILYILLLGLLEHLMAPLSKWCTMKLWTVCKTICWVASVLHEIVNMLRKYHTWYWTCHHTPAPRLVHSGHLVLPVIKQSLSVVYRFFNLTLIKHTLVYRILLNLAPSGQIVKGFYHPSHSISWFFYLFSFHFYFCCFLQVHTFLPHSFPVVCCFPVSTFPAPPEVEGFFARHWHSPSASSPEDCSSSSSLHKTIIRASKYID